MMSKAEQLPHGWRTSLANKLQNKSLHNIKSYTTDNIKSHATKDSLKLRTSAKRKLSRSHDNLYMIENVTDDFQYLTVPGAKGCSFDETEETDTIHKKDKRSNSFVDHFKMDFFSKFKARISRRSTSFEDHSRSGDADTSSQFNRLREKRKSETDQLVRQLNRKDDDSGEEYYDEAFWRDVKRKSAVDHSLQQLQITETSKASRVRDALRESGLL